MCIPTTYGSFSSAVSLFFFVGVFDSLVRFSDSVSLVSPNQKKHKVLLVIRFSRQTIPYYSETNPVQYSVCSWSECWSTPNDRLNPRLAR